mmetsp:Transcript_6755/g.12718  ORF Transcript_6755/g.12718 Transcript_6755/m.12718 type:complete len:126 (-) Transcript_6755:40-417(-)
MIIQNCLSHPCRKAISTSTMPPTILYELCTLSDTGRNCLNHFPRNYPYPHSSFITTSCRTSTSRCSSRSSTSLTWPVSCVCISRRHCCGHVIAGTGTRERVKDGDYQSMKEFDSTIQYTVATLCS